MAVEATHLTSFPPQPTQDRDLFNHQFYNMHFIGNTFAGALPENQPFYSPVHLECIAPDSRKRPRNDLPQMQQFQMDIDSLIADHSKKIRLELAERQKQQAILLAGTIGERLIRKLREKDDQIQRMGKLNLVLQEKVKSLYIENQLLRDLAQSSEAAVNSLRTNLQQVLLHVGGEERVPDAADLEQEVGSCCGSNGVAAAEAGDQNQQSCYGDRRCRKCGQRESCVLLLPCRHLCLCNVCGSGSHHLPGCPVCHSAMTATLHVDLSN